MTRSPQARTVREKTGLAASLELGMRYGAGQVMTSLSASGVFIEPWRIGL
jgi:hypothetical protein